MNTATVSNTNLFAIAAAYLGDATQWVRIAQLNGLADSTLSGTSTLALPAVDPTAGGGIVSIDSLAAYPVLPIDIYAAAPTPIVRGPGIAIWDGFIWDDGSVWV